MGWLLFLGARLLVVQRPFTIFSRCSHFPFSILLLSAPFFLGLLGPTARGLPVFGKPEVRRSLHFCFPLSLPCHWSFVSRGTGGAGDGGAAPGPAPRRPVRKNGRVSLFSSLLPSPSPRPCPIWAGGVYTRHQKYMWGEKKEFVTGPRCRGETNRIHLCHPFVFSLPSLYLSIGKLRRIGRSARAARAENV